MFWRPGRAHFFQPLLGGVERVAEQLDAVAIGILDVDALGHAVVDGAELVDLVVLLELVVVVLELLVVLDLDGHVVQAQPAVDDFLRPFLGLEQGQVMVDAAAGQERAEPRPLHGDLESQHVGVKPGRRFLVFDVDNQMPDPLRFRHRSLRMTPGESLF